MGFLREATGVLDGKQVLRWAQLLPPDEATQAPECRVQVCYVSLERSQQMQKDYRGPAGLIDYGAANRNPKYRRTFCAAAIVDWAGMTRTNIRRLCARYLADDSALAGVPAEGLPFTPEDRDQLAVDMTLQAFVDVQNAAMELQAFVEAQMEREKNAPGSSSASA